MAAGERCGFRSKDVAAGKNIEKLFLALLSHFYLFSSDSRSFGATLVGAFLSQGEAKVLQTNKFAPYPATKGQVRMESPLVQFTADKGVVTNRWMLQIEIL